MRRDPDGAAARDHRVGNEPPVIGIRRAALAIVFRKAQCRYGHVIIELVRGIFVDIVFSNLHRLFNAKESTFGTMRIKSGDSNSRSFNAPTLQLAIREIDDRQDAIASTGNASLRW